MSENLETVVKAIKTGTATRQQLMDFANQNAAWMFLLATAAIEAISKVSASYLDAHKKDVEMLKEVAVNQSTTKAQREIAIDLMIAKMKWNHILNKTTNIVLFLVVVAGVSSVLATSIKERVKDIKNFYPNKDAVPQKQLHEKKEVVGNVETKGKSNKLLNWIKK